MMPSVRLLSTSSALLVPFLFLFLRMVVLVGGETQQCSSNSATTMEAPFVTPPSAWLPSSIDLAKIPSKEVLSYAQPTDSCDTDGNTLLKSVAIGSMPQFRTEDTLQVLEEAVEAWKGGSGVWTTMPLSQRVQCLRRFFHELRSSREDIVTALQWEIGKNRKDAEAEFDRTLSFAEQLMQTVTTHPDYVGQWETVPGTKVTALTRRAAIGIILALAPYNYPINESYATIIPALLLGNIVILKIPTVGGLAHLLTMEAFRKALPAGAIHFVAGPGRSTMPPLMETGKIDGLAFIGGSSAADQLIHAHPYPHRLKVFLQLEAKNMGILLKDVFEGSNDNAAVLDNAVAESVLGSLSYNGQRCTALKLFFVPTQFASTFVDKLVTRIEALPVGLSWQTHGDDGDGSSPSSNYSLITPLPNPGRIEYMQSLIEDAVGKGARIVNENGGNVVGGPESTLMVPAVLYPVTPDMKIYHEEQFGPIVPVATYDDLETVLQYGRDGMYGQQVSIFGQDSVQTALLLDRFASVFGKVNLNQQCGRSPDTLPFSGRRSSAMGVMSVSEALREFSVPTVVAHKSEPLNGALVQGLNEKAAFLPTIRVQ